MNIFSNELEVRNIIANPRVNILGINDVTLREIKERVDNVGYAVISDVVDPDLVLGIRSRYFEMFPGICDRYGHVTTEKEFEMLMKCYGRDTHPSKVIQQSDEYKLLVKSSNLKSISQYIIQSDVRLVHYLVLRNYGKFSSSATMVHFDEVYINNPPKQMSNFWIPLGRVSIETGTLAYLPGSHRLDVYQLKSSYHKHYGIKPKGGYPFGNNLDEISNYLNVNPWEYVELEPGAVVVHYPLILHSGTDSFSEYCRLSTDIRFVPVEWHEDKRWDEPWGANSMKKWPPL